MKVEELRVALEAEVSSISNPEIELLVNNFLKKVPDPFWTRESSKKHHPPDEAEEGGNVLHTLRVISLCRVILQAGDYSQEEADNLVTAASLHDTFRHDKDGNSRATVPDHPKLAADLVRELGGDEDIAKIIDTHMGRWGEPKYLVKLRLQTVLHLADLIASRTNVRVDV